MPSTPASAMTAMDNRRVRTRMASLLVTMWIRRAAAALAPVAGGETATPRRRAP
jgi:hypothetical protein